MVSNMVILRAELNYSSNVKPRNANKICGGCVQRFHDCGVLGSSKTGTSGVADDRELDRRPPLNDGHCFY